MSGPAYAPSRPPLDTVATELYRSLLPLAWDDENQGWALLYYLAAHGLLYQELSDLVRDTDAGPGWSPIMDVDRAPLKALPWLGQFVGVTVDTSRSEDAQRGQIRDENSWKRGTPAAMTAAAQATLTGTRTVLMFERDTDAYHLTVNTFADETPDPAATLAALISQKPAGIVLAYSTGATWTWQILRNSFATWQNVKDHYTTWRNVRADNPPH